MNALRAEQAVISDRNEGTLTFPEYTPAPIYHKELILCMAKEFKGYKGMGLPSLMDTGEFCLGNFYPNEPLRPVKRKDRGDKNNPLIPLLILKQRIIESGKTVAFYGTCLTRKNNSPEAEINMTTFCFRNCGCGDVRLVKTFQLPSESLNQAEARKQDMSISRDYFSKLQTYFGRISINFFTLEIRENQWFLGETRGYCKPEQAVKDYEKRWGRGLTEIIINQEESILKKLY